MMPSSPYVLAQVGLPLAAAGDGPITRDQVLLGLGVAVGSILLGRLLPYGLRPLLARRRSPSFARVFSALTGGLVAVLGVLIGLTIVFPSIDPVAVLSSLGILGIAAGFAFQDILSNLLAGILLLMRDPFRGGDQITVDGHTGTVVEINLRETVLKTYDGRRLTIPNATVYTNPILVQTAFDAVRTSVVVGVDYSTDLDAARGVAEEAVAGVEGVLDDPAVQVYATTFGSSTVDLDIRYWTAPEQAEIRRVQDAVIGAVLQAYNDAGIDMPDQMMVLQGSPSLTAALHDRGHISSGGSVRP
jgi:small-conductance mechanosensitive channel